MASITGERIGCFRRPTTPVTMRASTGRSRQPTPLTARVSRPGNPFGRLMARLRSALCRRITEEDVEAIADKLIEKARAGDVPAARLLLSYGIGKPTEAVNPDTLDMQEWDVYRKSPVSLDDLRGIIEGIPVEVVGPIVRVSKPYLNAAASEQVMNVLNPEPKPKRSRKERREERRRQAAAAAAR